jgi:hypothetical protein
MVVNTSCRTEPLSKDVYARITQIAGSQCAPSSSNTVSNANARAKLASGNKWQISTRLCHTLQDFKKNFKIQRAVGLARILIPSSFAVCHLKSY